MPLWKGTEVERQHFGGLNKLVKNARIVCTREPVVVQHHSLVRRRGWLGSANSPLQASLHQEGVGGMDDAAAGGLSTAAFGPMTRFDAFAAHNAAA